MSRYFIWRFTKNEPWRVYGTKHHFMPRVGYGQPVAWEGEDYRDALNEDAENAREYHRHEKSLHEIYYGERV